MVHLDRSTVTQLAFRLLGSAVLCVLACGAAKPGSEQPANPPVEMSVRLPPFVVTELRDGLPWKYGRAGNFEVISLCSNMLTREFVAALVRGSDFYPESLQAQWTTPVQIVLFDRQAGGPKVATVTTTFAPSRLGDTAHVTLFDGNITVSNRDYLVCAANLENIREWTAVSDDYAHSCFLTLSPAAPTWLREGLIGPSGIYHDCGINTDKPAFRIAAFLWISEEETERLRRHPKDQPSLLPLGALFADRFAEEPPESAAFRLGSAQSALFVYWALYGRSGPGAERNDFWRFVADARREPVTEALFQKHFHVGYAAASAAMWAYAREAIRAPRDIYDRNLYRKLPEIESMEFRPATEAEVARLKGNWERLEAADLAATFPDLAAKYREASGRSLRRGYRIAGDSDPALLGVLGLYEYENGQFSDARDHLERAAASYAVSTRGLLALARLRLDEIRRAAPDDQLNADQLGLVLAPLYAARARSPAVAEVYLQIAEAWAASEIKPGPDHLAILVEGTRLFPRDMDLLYATAELHLRHGYQSEAAALTTTGLKLAGAGPQHDRFAGLQTGLTEAATPR